LPAGRRLELAMPLGEFAGEAKEIGDGLLLVSLGSGMLALLVAIAATTRAFRPLRQATKLLRNVDAQHLGQRLPLLGTGDPVDLHGQTLNKILEDVDSAFSRLRAFSGDVAHELRTPLNRIGNVADVALEGDDPAELRSALETIRRSSHDLTVIIQSLLLIAEIDDGRHQIQRQTIDADSFLDRSIGAFAPLFEEKDIQLSIDTDPGSICGDRGLLDRVFVNLLDNALHHTPPGTRVEVQCRQSEGGVMICVEDSGTGIPPDERERVFDRFVRLGASATGHGVGLGLALSRAIARLHGGELSVEASALGGARFVWRVPGA
jgi:signal transduction histidine kinase